MALVVTLALLVLVTVLVFAFFTVSAANRTLQSSRASQIKAEILAQTAAEYVTDRFFREIVDNSTNVVTGGGAASIFLPLARTNIVPQRLVAPTVASSTDFPTLVRQSVATADTNASTHATFEPARNSRLISLQRWNSPRLTLGSGFTSNAVPAWIYVSPTNGPGATPSKEAVGRFAYNVYNTGGLLDVNAAGHPETLFVGTARPKDTLAGAALRQLNVSVAALVRMGQFRSPADMGSKEAYMSNARAFASDGYRDTVATVTQNGAEHSYTNNFLYDRQDLIRFARSLGNDTTLSAALPYLTTFSRARTGPTWEPTMNATNFPGYYAAAQAVTTHRYKDDALKTNAVNPRLLTFTFERDANITHYRDDGRIERDDPSQTYSYTAAPGTPVVHRKFSLAKLAWLGPHGPNTNAFHASVTANEREKAISDTFGLQWDESGMFPKWVYDHGESDRILTLNEVRLAEREPDFFELLKAVILEGSLGKHPGPGKLGPYTGSDATPVGSLRSDQIYDQKDGQVLQIGANIIDQADSDRFPTAIASGIPLENFANPEVFSAKSLEYFGLVLGVENIPYIARIWNPVLIWGQNKARGWWWPELWSPHRRSTVTGGLKPDLFRIRGLGFSRTDVTFDPNDDDATNPERQSPNVDHESDAVGVEFMDPDPGKFYDRPRRLQQDLDDFAGSATDPGNKYDPVKYPLTNLKVLGIFAGEVDYREPIRDVLARLAQERVIAYPIDTRVFFNAHSTFLDTETPPTLVMDYRDDKGVWRPASMVARFNKNRRNSHAAGEHGVVKPDFNDSVIRSGVGKIDLRTERFGASSTEEDRWKYTGQMWRAATATPLDQGLLPFFGPDATTGIYRAAPEDKRGRFGDFVRNVAGLDNFYSDPDGVVRSGDGIKMNMTNDDGNPLLVDTDPSSSAQPKGTATQSRRPIVLDRPFQTVAELGAVFRDSPMRTLDFWTRDSADAGLLEVFSVRNEPRITSGKINPNVAPNLVLRAILMDAAKHAADPAVPRMTLAEATAAANAFSSAFVSSPLMNGGEYASFLADAIAASLNASLKANKTLAESPVRALSEISNFRSWTFLIDIVAQSGRFPGTGMSGRDFMVDGEKRIWFHVTIDRYTGEILGSQTESVYE